MTESITMLRVRYSHWITPVIVAAIAVNVTSCSLANMVDVDPLSVGTQVNVNDVGTVRAAEMMYSAAIGGMASAWSNYSLDAAFWTDELTSSSFANESVFAIDLRRAPFCLKTRWCGLRVNQSIKPT